MITDMESSDGRKPRKRSRRPTKSGKPHNPDENPLFSRSMAAKMVRYGNSESGKLNREKSRQHLNRIRQGGRPLGSYDGMRKDERDRVNAAAKEYAKETIKIMADKGIIKSEDDPRAVEALEAALTTMRTPANQGTKLAAAKLILEYTKAKPATKSEVTVNKAEEWLAAIASEEKNGTDAEGTEGDAQATS